MGSRRRAWLLFKLWKNLEKAEKEWGRASRRHNSRCSAGDTEEFIGWKDVNTDCKAFELIDYSWAVFKNASRRLSGKTTETAAHGGSHAFRLCGLVTLWWQQGSPGTHSMAPLARSHFHARILYNLISSKGWPFKWWVGSSLLFFPSFTRDLTLFRTLCALAHVHQAPVL